MDVQAWMEQWNMFPSPGGTILCAVSGGRDSMCLLHQLNSLSKQRDFRVAAAHYNHLMRTTAQRDENFVRDFCEKEEIPFYVGRGSVYGISEQTKIGVEETGRRLRYEFLEKTAKEIGAEKIATAHHAGDQAETVLLNLFRGTGMEGLTGIPPVRGNIIRPLLSTTREEIEEYLQSIQLGNVEDETNTNLDFARNRLRLVVWPELEKINSAVRKNIVRTASIVRKENEYLDELAAAYLPEDGLYLSIEQLNAAPNALKPRMIRSMIQRLPVGRKDFGAVHFESVLALSEKSGSLNLPHGAKVRCDGKGLYFEMTEILPTEMTLTEGEQQWGEYSICVTDAGTQESPNDIILRFQGDEKLTVRTWSHSDRLFLEGSNGERSLKRLCVDTGISPKQRDELPIICINGEVATVWKVGTDTKYMPKENEKTILLKIKRGSKNEEQHE